jgi:sugar lactone lactonase YvrE
MDIRGVEKVNESRTRDKSFVAGDIEKIAGGFQFTEGPIWVPEGYLLFSDIPANIIYKWTPGGSKPEVFRTPSGPSNGLTLDRELRLLACELPRGISRTKEDGEIVILADRYEGKRLNSPNDLVVKSDGNVYFTDPAYGLRRTGLPKELDFNGVFRLAPDGDLILLDDTFEGPNGLAFSPDEKVLYVDDSARGHIRAFDVKADGTVTNGRIFAELQGPGEGVPDGMKVDIQGNVYCTGAGGIWVLDEAGEKLEIIEFLEPPANLAWGDDDLKTMYVTARTGVYRVRTRISGALSRLLY